MSESFPDKINRMEHEKALPEGKEIRLEIAQKAAEHAKAEQDTVAAVAEARKQVAETAKPESRSEALKQLEEAENVSQQASHSSVDHELRLFTKRRELQNLRRKLSAPQKVLSRVIHQPAVQVTSEALGRTISRPSGLLGGGLIAFLGTTVYLFMAKYLGFRYNYTVFLVLFFGGFIAGIALELMARLTTKSTKKD